MCDYTPCLMTCCHLADITRGDGGGDEFGLEAGSVINFHLFILFHFIIYLFIYLFQSLFISFI